MWSHYHRLLWPSLLLLLLQSVAQGDNNSDAEVEAAVIFNFFKFIEWPAEAGNEQQLIICSNDEGAVIEALQMLEGKTVNGKILQVRRHLPAEDLRRCQIVYMENPRAAILRDLRAYPVVTVSSSSDFIEQGGMIVLAPERNHLGFDINQELALSNGVRISALLLKLARSVRNGM